MADNNSSSELWKFQSESESDCRWKESDRQFYRTLNEIRIGLGLLPVNYSDSMEDQVYDRTILVKIHFLKYSISCRELDMVFSRFGVLEKLEILSPRSLFHSRICFENKESARMAFDSLNGRNVYDDCCELELFLMREIMIEPSENVEKECKSFDSSLQRTHYNIGNQVEDRTLLVQIHLLEYKVSYKELELVFSRFGILENIEILDPNAEFHSKVCFEKKESALEAINFLNGRNVYDGCCKLELILEKDLLRNQSEDQCPTTSKEFSDEMPMSDNSEKLQDNCNWDLSKEFASLNISLRSFDSDMQENQSNNNIEVFDDLEIDGFSVNSSKWLNIIVQASCFGSGKEHVNSSHVLIGHSQEKVASAVLGKETSRQEFCCKNWLSWKEWSVDVCMEFREEHVFDPCGNFSKSMSGLKLLLESSVLLSNWIEFAGNSNHALANGEPVFMPFDRGKEQTLHASEVVEVGEMHFVKIGDVSVDKNTQESEYLEEESGVYVNNLIGSTSLNTIKIKGLVFDPGGSCLQPIKLQGCGINNEEATVC